MRIMRPSISSMTASIIGWEAVRSARSLTVSSQCSTQGRRGGATSGAGNGEWLTVRITPLVGLVQPTLERPLTSEKIPDNMSRDLTVILADEPGELARLGEVTGTAG